jgi:hypothetical protein
MSSPSKSNEGRTSSFVCVEGLLGGVGDLDENVCGVVGDCGTVSLQVLNNVESTG